MDPWGREGVLYADNNEDLDERIGVLQHVVVCCNVLQCAICGVGRACWLLVIMMISMTSRCSFIYVCIYKCIPRCSCLYVYMCIYIYMHVYTNLCIYIIDFDDEQVLTYIYIYIQIYTHVLVYICADTYIYIYTQIYIHTYIQTYVYIYM